ncbi:hypothetical protein L1279_003487 [Planomicrobium sp. HSC-17F08]|nr:hypothetical protein [Planomicrobium sp. HSC-17F08]
MIEVISWIFGGIMSLLGFVTLFIAFSYEHRILTASRIKQQIMKPYALSKEEIILNYSEYKSYIYKDFLINFIFWIFVIVSNFSILIWGLILIIYADFNFTTETLLDLTQSINIIGFLIWFLMSFLLIGISILLNLIRFNKDPLEKGYLIDEHSLSDIEMLLTKKGDLEELLYKIAPTISFLKNPIENWHELNIYFPLKLKNTRFVAKVDGFNDEAPFRIYGVLKDINNVGEGFYEILSSKININELKVSPKTTITLKFYNKSNKLIALFKMKARELDDDIIFDVSKKISLNIISNDNDFRDVERLQREQVSYTK